MGLGKEFLDMTITTLKYLNRYTLKKKLDLIKIKELKTFPL